MSVQTEDRPGTGPSDPFERETPEARAPMVLAEVLAAEAALAAAEALRDELMRDLYEGGWTTDRIAPVVGLSKSRVHVRLTALAAETGRPVFRTTRAGRPLGSKNKPREETP